MFRPCAIVVVLVLVSLWPVSYCYQTSLKTIHFIGTQCDRVHLIKSKFNKVSKRKYRASAQDYVKRYRSLKEDGVHLETLDVSESSLGLALWPPKCNFGGTPLSTEWLTHPIPTKLGLPSVRWSPIRSLLKLSPTLTEF